MRATVLRLSPQLHSVRPLPVHHSEFYHLGLSPNDWLVCVLQSAGGGKQFLVNLIPYNVILTDVLATICIIIYIFGLFV